MSGVLPNLSRTSTDNPGFLSKPLYTKHDIISLIAHIEIKINLPGVFVGTFPKELEQRGDVGGGGGW
jgi:hypothetical protein